MQHLVSEKANKEGYLAAPRNKIGHCKDVVIMRQSEHRKCLRRC